ncbi:uncharacterized protein LOC129716264 [Leucoraja erinacea]|uniref:uncharacterized protein LOC129716264 n=1 Tax=Leucoraja erinaceus TaxID=7782 RepID=UPI0024552226|nr:uncharacterized protein LOC129716264 [Leucoraja erinacea]
MNHRKFKPKPGDLIEIPRKGGYKDWALYMGDGDVVHLTSDGASGDTSTRFSRSEEIGVIKREPLADVAGNNSWKVNNRSDIIWNPLPVDKIIKKAKENIGCRVRYKVLSANCEHFVNSLRYGIQISFQFKPKPGDLIEIRRGLFTHWALYIGHEDVVHLTSDGASGDTSTRFSRSEGIGVIKREPLDEVVGNDSWKVNNGSDGMWNPLPVDKIIKKANEMIGCRVRYKVLSANCEHFVNSLRYGIEISFQFKPKPGDLIEIRRGLFTHWALYIGHGDVVHLNFDGVSGDTSTRFSRSEGIGVIEREPLDEVVGNDSWKVNNGSDGMWNPLPVDKIIKKAKEMIGYRVRYNVLSANCEHFVNSLRYGKGVSFQVIAGIGIFGATAFFSPVAAVAALGAACLFNVFPSVSSSLNSTSLNSTSLNSTSLNSTSVKSTKQT